MYIKILLFIISLHNIYNLSIFKTIPLENDSFLIINKNGIYLFNKNVIEERYIFENKNEKLSTRKNIKNIYFSKNSEKKDIIFLFIKGYIYIFSFRGDFIKKSKYLNEPVSRYYLIQSYEYIGEKSNEYYYSIMYITNKNSIIIKVYKYNYFANKNSLYLEKEISLPNSLGENAIKYNKNFLCHLMLDKSNKTLLNFFLQSKEDKKFLFLQLEINIHKKIINYLNSIKPLTKLKFGGEIIKSINNKEKTKTLICTKDKKEINCIIYDSIKNGFSQCINFLNNCNPILFNINNLNNKYIIDCPSSSKEINIVELNEDFQYESTKIFTINNGKLFNENTNKKFYYLTKNLNSYHILYYSDKNKYPYFTVIEINLDVERKIKRKLQNDGNGENSGSSEKGGDGDNEEYGKNGGNSEEGGVDNISGNNENGQNNDKTESKGGGSTKEGGYTFDFDNKETNIPKDEIKDKKNDIMSNVEVGESYSLKGDGYSIKVAPIGEKEEGSTSIDFASCEEKIREANDLDDSYTLTVFQIETDSSSERTLTNKVQYVVYDEDNNELDLSVCSEEKISISYALKEGTNFSLSLFESFNELGIDILNSSDSFFNDICYTYSSNGSDIILSDRIAEIYQNYSLCDSGCEYEGLDTEDLTVSCSCSVSTNDTDDDNEEANIKEIILNLFEDSTFGVVKCYKLVFSFTNKKKNIGFWVFLCIIIINIPLYVLFFINGINPIKKFVEAEMELYHYLLKPNNGIKNKELNKGQNLNFAKNNVNTDGNINKEEVEETDRRMSIVISNKIPTSHSSSQRIYNNTHNSKDLIEKEGEVKREETNNNIVEVYNISKEAGIENEKNKAVSYQLIKIDANNSINNIPPESNYNLTNYDYDTALKYDKRTFWRVLYIVMLTKDNILNTFILKSPLESQPLRISLLIFAYSCNLALNTLFYFSDNISDKYHYTGNNLFWYTLFNNALISVISTILSLVLGSILKAMTDSKKSIENEFKKEEEKMRKDEKYTVSNERKEVIIKNINSSLSCLKLKMIIFVALDFILLLFFFYFVTSFCEVYQSTQVSWISDAVFSIIISFPIELAISLAITIVYKLSLKNKWKFFYGIAILLV